MATPTSGRSRSTSTATTITSSAWARPARSPPPRSSRSTARPACTSHERVPVLRVRRRRPAALRARAAGAARHLVAGDDHLDAVRELLQLRMKQPRRYDDAVKLLRDL